MTIDITTATLVLVYAGMAGYIVYLQSRLSKIRKDAGMMAMMLHEMAEGNVTVERRNGKLNISRHQSQTD